MSSLQPFSVDNTWSHVVSKRTGDKREYGGDNLSSESSNFLPTDQTDKQPSSPGGSLWSDREGWSSQFDLPSSPVRKKRFLGGIQFTERSKNKEEEGGDEEGEGESESHIVSLQSNGTVTEDKPEATVAKLERQSAAESSSTPVRTASRPSLLAPTTPYRNYTRSLNSFNSFNSYNSLGSFGETGAGIAAEVASPEKRHKPAPVDTTLPPAQYLLQCADKEAENIDLMFRNLDKLPKEFSELKNVVKTNNSPCTASLAMSYKVMLSQNRLTDLPPQLFDGINIVNLSVFNNCLESVPPRIRDLTNLDTLNVSGNVNLKYLPSDIQKLKKLKNLKASNVGFPPLPKGAPSPAGKKRHMLHREITVVNEEKVFPTLIEQIVMSVFKAKDGQLTDKQIAHLNVHQMGRQYFEDAQLSFQVGTSCGVCGEHILYEDRVYGYATEWWQWPGHEEASVHDQQVIVIRRLLCKEACLTELERMA
ncbi:YALI0F03322p [Yarrowia lipolytica CLIB122]|jgi:hypothetical protein|uniref:YALI0F03322p n=2 Tax=Yarrowia lipolytica TaxID=4952 RepID=Q6C320_YARLI|nr:YALI0F03322p [Yarrowia lipolytica CLIB122]AOW06580.1 hypothetical protein YALI1_F04626g [Yarrowia lipolytica]KAB8280622.1 hypothetical protein BKA91DRAFT_141648 [Yarrowia lipolytica]KAE8169745.1 hypothetical protein BKA90DRAFT_142042 [Yarrowia lipolytica]KAJ8056175.1 hypothetical protein LXG23DRAFT_35806 [Yarrowia lipolytica]QNQ01386.1 Hypothetical protein YALI2_F00931g [Yarrowia lipolytica]|eukprot:XP_504942.1 YALI0F03322p [Yarrowia lipolytica CLIB122]